MRVTSAEFVTSVAVPSGLPPDRYPEVAFAGRSNVGKSSLLNRLLGRRGLARVSRTPGRTQTLNFYRVNGTIYLVDLPGYGYARVPEPIRRSWGPLVEKYLRGRASLRGLVLILDGRHCPSPLDVEMREWLLAEGIPHQIVLTKMDKVSRGRWQPAQREAARVLHVEDPRAILCFSAVTGEGEEGLRRFVGQTVGAARARGLAG